MVNLLSVASGERLLGRGRSRAPGARSPPAAGTLMPVKGEEERHVATILTTIFKVGEV